LRDFVNSRVVGTQQIKARIDWHTYSQLVRWPVGHHGERGQRPGDGKPGRSGRWRFDLDGGVTSIQSPAIRLPATGTLSLTLSQYLAHGSNASSADFLRVSVVHPYAGQAIRVLMTQT
jgi:hypothetical protein